MLQERIAEIMSFIKKHKVALAPGHPDGYGGEPINKVPCVANPAKTASDSPEAIQSWLCSDENRTMFLPCGSRNNLIVIDCDIRDGINGIEQFLDYCKRHGIEPSDVFQNTPSGGRHYFYKFDERCYGNRTKIKLEGVKVNIDVKSEGGLIRVDPQNKTYVITGCLQDAPLLPECLIEEIKVNPPDPYDCDDNQSTQRIHEYMENVKELINAGCNEILKAGIGERNSTINKVAFFTGRELAAATPEEWETAKLRFVDAAKSVNIGEKEARATIESGFHKGVEKGGFRSNEKVPNFMRNLKFIRDNIIEEDGVFRRLPETPTYMLGKNAMDVIDTVSANRKVPVEMSMGLLLGLAGVCIGNSCSISYDRNWKEFANLFLLFVGESGIGKSLAYSIIFEALLERQGDLKEQFAEQRQEYETKLAEWRKSKKDGMPKPMPPRNIQYVLNDSTIEGAIELLKDNPRGISWYIDEGRKFFSRLDRYTNNSGDGRSKLLSGWDSQSLSVMRKTHNNESNEIYIKKGTFSLISGIQPSFVPEFITHEDAEQGLTQRFLFIRAQEKQPPTYPLKEIPEEIDMRLRLITNKLLRIAALGEARGRLKKENAGHASVEGFTEEENKLPTEFYLNRDSKILFDNEMTDKARTTFGGDKYSYVKKSNKQTLRLALILHLLKWASSDNDSLSVEISHETMVSAIKLINWFSQHLERVLNLMPQKTKDVKVDNGTLNDIAAIILKHRNEIEGTRNKFIPNKIWKQWIFDGDLCLSNKSMRYMMDELRSVKHQTASDRGRIFTTECLEYCEKLCESSEYIFKDEYDKDFDPALAAQKKKQAEIEAEQQSVSIKPFKGERQKTEDIPEDIPADWGNSSENIDDFSGENIDDANANQRYGGNVNEIGNNIQTDAALNEPPGNIGRNSNQFNHSDIMSDCLPDADDSPEIQELLQEIHDMNQQKKREQRE